MKPARQEILEKLKETTIRLPEMPDFESPVFHEQEGSPEIVFKKKPAGGKRKGNQLQTGSALVSSAQEGGRKLFIYPPQHLVIASKKQIVNTLNEAYSAISKKYGNNLPSQLLLITGPGRTADVEKTLTLGAHGPKSLHVFLY